MNNLRKIPFLILIIILFSSRLIAKAKIDVLESTIKLSALGDEEKFYYGFAEGDQIIFSIEELNGKKMKKVEISEYPSSSRFIELKTKKIENKVINVSKTGIYSFIITNTASSIRMCKIKIQRIPASEATQSFNTTVYWQTKYDTIYTQKVEKYLDKSDTIIQEIYAASPKISSKNALNKNNNFQVIDFQLPENTISWSFYIGTGKKGESEFENAKANFTKNAINVVSKIPGYGPMAALAISGVSYFNQVQGEDNVKYWMLKNEKDAALFNTEKTFDFYKNGDVINEASQMKTPLKGKVYIGLLNDNILEPITVTINATAVIVNPTWKSKKIQDPKVTERQEPYLKN